MSKKIVVLGSLPLLVSLTTRQYTQACILLNVRYL
jgi:hypothetical protein